MYFIQLVLHFMIYLKLNNQKDGKKVTDELLIYFLAYIEKSNWRKKISHGLFKQ